MQTFLKGKIIDDTNKSKVTHTMKQHSHNPSSKDFFKILLITEDITCNYSAFSMDSVMLQVPQKCANLYIFECILYYAYIISTSKK